MNNNIRRELNRIVIDDVVIFSQCDGLLINMATEESFQLNKTACGCLRMMLDASHDIVLHKDFMEKIWGDAELSNNILYQNISFIRKGFESLNCRDVITTVSRKGFKISDDVVVTTMDESESISSPPTHDNKSRKREHDLFLYQKMTFGIISFISIAVLIFYVSEIYKISVKEEFVERYRFLTSEGGCDYYINVDAHHINKNAMKQSERFLNCSSYPYVYMTSWQQIPSIRIIACDNLPIHDKSPDCISYYIRGVFPE
ncbi:MAG: winged helix-turn-helix domain-containing protein [Citrobacter amalonaticus]|jgi:DNA-binding winged helix-turn-helix (wHTH) protein|nr:winged helix-turn-helix domain-containing protein [Citrobacter amalonaticus]